VPPGGGARMAVVAWPCRGGVFTIEGGGSRSEKDGSGNALIGGALCGVWWHCSLLGDARHMTMMTSSTGVSGPLVRWCWRPPWRGRRYSLHDGGCSDSWWSCSSCPNLTRSEDSSGGAHHLCVGWLSFLYSLGVLCGLLVSSLCFNSCSWLSQW
jgi:hypothetical protein